MNMNPECKKPSKDLFPENRLSCVKRVVVPPKIPL